MRKKNEGSYGQGNIVGFFFFLLSSLQIELRQRVSGGKLNQT